MKKVRMGLQATMMAVKPEALKRELKRQGPTTEVGEWFSLEKSGFKAEEMREIASAIVAERDEYVSEGISSGAATNAYRRGWDAVFGKPRAKA